MSGWSHGTRWERAYDAQLEVWNLWNTELGARYAKGFVQSVREKGRAFTGVHHLDSPTPYEEWRADMSNQNFLGMLAKTGGGDDTQGLILTERSKSYRAEPIFVSHEIMDLVEAASESFVPEPLLPTDLIVPFGFVLLPRPLSMIDASNKRASFRAIAWMPAHAYNEETGEVVKEGITLSLYSSTSDLLNPEVDDYADAYDEEMRAAMGPWGLLHITAWMFNEPVPRHFTIEKGWWRSIQCLFRLSMQYISVREKHYPDRPTRKRAQRLGFEPRDVTVVKLRRPRQQHERTEGGNVEWSHRWVVGGHWRNQYYPSLKAHRQIWIAPYIKGPEDKELHLRKTRAFEFVR